MTNEDIEKLIRFNQRLLLLLGYATNMILSHRDSVFYDSNESEKIEWLLKSFENVVYLDKPLEGLNLP